MVCGACKRTRKISYSINTSSSSTSNAPLFSNLHNANIKSGTKISNLSSISYNRRNTKNYFKSSSSSKQFRKLLIK